MFLSFLKLKLAQLSASSMKVSSMITLLYPSVSTRAAIGQFCGPYFKIHWHLPWCTAHCLCWFDRMGRALSRGKIIASHLEEEMNIEFEISVVSNFLVSRGGPVRYQKPVKHFCGLCFGPLNPPLCSSRRGHFLRLQKSHPKEKQWRRRRRKIVPTFTECLRSMRTKLKPPENREVFSAGGGCF